jgi:hypothetical protein
MVISHVRKIQMKFSLGVQSPPALAYDSVAHMIQAKVLVDSAKLLAEIHCALLMDKTFDNVDKQKLKHFRVIKLYLLINFNLNKFISLAKSG